MSSKNVKLSKSVLSILLCTSLIASCGASKDSKSGTPTIGTTTVTPPPPAPGSPQNPALPAETSTVAEKDGDLDLGVDDIDDLSINPQDKNSKKNVKVSAPLFSEAVALKTGGTTGDLSYATAADDGIMELFRVTAKTAPAEQQALNLKLAQTVNKARLVKGNGGMILDLELNELGQLRSYRMQATQEGNVLKLASLQSTGDLVFEGGYVKCLDAACDEAYARIKLSGAYTRIIFRSIYVNNEFMSRPDVQNAEYNEIRGYAVNTAKDIATDQKIASVRTASYEVLNGKSAMGVQIQMKNTEAISFNFQLVAPEAGTDVNQTVTKVRDLSTHYALPSTATKTQRLADMIDETKLVKNNGKGQIKLQMKIGPDVMWLVLTRTNKKSLTASEVKAFEMTAPKL